MNEAVTVPVGRDKKIRTAPRTSQIAGFVSSGVGTELAFLLWI